MTAAAKRPAFSALASLKYAMMPTLEEAIAAYFSKIESGKKILTTQNITDERL